ncbi:Cytochrome P450 71B37 [Acorus gramineus]|uniref:Cytochrome P450 71B37 n=1 Tax=Acorus gramineus TaxID=55184 RepID=A0AAV9BIE6_ACOGR|nr:Cytochrome P450 71B37 [Acorus gramineus]
MLVGGIDSGTVIMEWILSELMKPQSMKKLQNEIESVVGLDRMVDESDLPKLGYLDMVVNEGFRLHPPVPLLVPHLAMEDSVIMGYDIPKNTHVIVNVWAIGRDPKYWADPKKFIPERFMDLNVDVSGMDFRVIPFGSGRRRCPGVHLGMVVVRLVTAQLVHCFNWEFPNGMSLEDLDMEKEFGLSVPRKNSLVAVPTYPMKDSVIMGYDILKNTRVIVNAWAIGRDPESWTDPEEFIPERFTDLNVDIGGTDFKIIPFGSGRRRCPGMHLGAAVVQFVMAQLVHCFDWELPNGMSPEDLDMEEEFGLTVPRKNSLVAVPTYRLLGDAV